MKISANDMAEMMFNAFGRGHAEGHKDGYQQAQDSISALVKENSQLKRELDTIESRAKTRVMTAEQRASFPAVYKEQQRIVVAIRRYFSVEDQHGPAWPADAVEELLLALALGDIK